MVCVWYVVHISCRLQTEMVLTLIVQMKKISDNNSEHLSKLEFNDDWTQVLSEYLGVCEAPFIRRQVRKVSSPSLKYVAFKIFTTYVIPSEGSEHFIFLLGFTFSFARLALEKLIIVILV